MKDTTNCFARRAMREGFGGIALALALWAGGGQAEEPVVLDVPVGWISTHRELVRDGYLIQDRLNYDRLKEQANKAL